jgi:hypothetical protein
MPTLAGAGLDFALQHALRLSEATARAATAANLTNFMNISPLSVAGSQGGIKSLRDRVTMKFATGKSQAIISTGVPGVTRAKRSMTSVLRMRTQPWLAGEPMRDS